MMTAEQFWPQWDASAAAVYSAKNPAYWMKFAESYAAAQLAELTAKLPETFFVGHDLAFRLERLVDGWQRAVTANLTLEAQLAEKEREILDLKGDAFEADLELTAAEQRLQEAQARTERAERFLRSAQDTGTMLDDEAEAAWDALGMSDYEGENGLDYFITQLRERLRQREAELEQRWIAVGERLPPRHVNVLCLNRDKSIFEGRICCGMHKPFFTYPRGDGNASNTAPAWIDVTHWQPLPSPPKEAQ